MVSDVNLMSKSFCFSGIYQGVINVKFKISQGPRKDVAMCNILGQISAISSHILMLK